MAIERLAPDAILEQTNLSGAVTAIDEDPDSADASWLTASSNNAATVVRVSFPTPSNPLTTGAGLQEFRVQVRKISGQSGNPQARVELYQNGTLVSTVVADTTITSTTGTVLSGTWDATGRTASQIECRVVGTQTGGNPSTRNTVEVGAIEWNANTSTNVPGTANPGTPALTVAVLPATASGGGGAGGGAISFVKEVSNFPDADGASHAIPISAAPVDGNLLVLSFITSGGDSVTAAVTDSAGNTWTERKTAPAGTSVTAYLYDCVPTNPLTTSDTVTVTLTASRAFAAVINEYEGQDSSPFDVTAGLGDGNSGVVTFDSGATATTAQADELAVAIFAHVSSSAGTITLDDTGYTARGSATSTGTIRSIHTYDKVLTATGVQEFSGSYTTARQSAAIVATYKAAAAAGGSTATPGTPALTVEALPVGSVGVHHARDTFTRTVSPGFGTPDLGPDWTAYDAGTTNWATTGSTGTISVPDSTYQNATIGDGVVDVVDSRTTIKFRWQSIPEGGFHTLAFYGRRQADILDKAIKTNVRVASTGAVTANSENKVGGVNTNLIAYTDTGLTVAANDWVLAEMEVEGQYPNAHVRVRVWLDGDPRPASPLYDVTTTGTDVDPGGTTGVWVQGSTSGSQVTWPVVFEVDEISLVAIDGTPPDFGGTAQPGTPALTTSVLAATSSGAAHVDTALASVNLAALTATARGAGTASPGTAALTAAVLAANASGAAVASPGLPSLTASALAATPTAAAVASPGTPSLTIAALAATASNGASTPTNFALLSKGATATASTTWTNPYLPNTAIDDDDQTGWASSTEPNGNWLRVDLGQNRRVNGYRLIQGTFGTFDRNNHADTWNVQYSDDDSTWTTAISNDAYTVDTGVVNFTEETHRYWRVIATSDTVSGGWVVTAFELWGDVTSADVERGSGTRTNNGESQTTLSATTMPTHDVDDTLIAVVGWKNSPTRTATTPVGWTKIDQVDGSGHSLAAYAKQAESSSETFSIVLSGAAAWSEVHVWRLSPAQAGTPATTNDTTSDTAAQIPGLTYDPTGMGQVLTVAMTSRGDRSLTAITGTDSSLGGNNQSWAPYFAMMSMWDTFEGTDPASTSATIVNGADTSVALRVGFTGVATGGGAATASPGTATATAAVLAATASGSALANPGAGLLTAAILSASALGEALAQPGTPSLTASVLSPTAIGDALASVGTPALSAAAQSPTATGQGSATAGTPALTSAAQAASATGAASAAVAAATATAQAQAATAKGEAVASPGMAELTIVVLHANAGGGSSIPGTAEPGLPSATASVLAATASGEALASAGLSSATVAALAAVATGAASATGATATATVAALSASASGEATAQPGTPSVSLAVLSPSVSGEALTQPGTPALTVEALHATAVAGGSAVATPGTATATAAALAASASGAARTTATQPAVSIVVLGATAHGSASSQPGTPALSVSPGSASATGSALAQPGAAPLTIAAQSPTVHVPAIASAGLSVLSVSVLNGAATGGGTGHPGTPLLSVEALSVSVSGDQGASAQPGTAEATIAALAATAKGAGRASPGTPAISFTVLHVLGSGQLATGPVIGITRSVGYLDAETRSLLRDYAITNSMPGLLALIDDLPTGSALTNLRDGLAAASQSEEDS